MTNCTWKEKRTALNGYVEALLQEPGTKVSEALFDRDPYHFDKGGVFALAEKNAEANGRKIPGDWSEIAEENPVWQKIAYKATKWAKGHQEEAQAILHWTSQENSVAKPIFDHFEQLIESFDPKEMLSDVYKSDVSQKAKEVLKEVVQAKVNAEQLPYSVNEFNFYPTQHFLETIRDGYPYFDFKGEAKGELGGKAIDWIAGNVTRGHMTLNLMTPVYHGLLTIPRAIAEYPAATLKALATMGKKDPQSFIGKPIPELESQGVYSKNLPGSPNNWTQYEWAKGLTFIPQCQTMAETLAYYISEHGGHSLDETMARVAIRPNPLKLPSLFVGKRSNLIAYGRYAMLTDAWYLNLLKRALLKGNTPEAWKARGTLAAYALMKTYLLGAKSAIPGPLSLIPAVKQWEDEESDEFDESMPFGANWVKKATGFDLGEHTKDLPLWWSVVSTYKMVEKNIQGSGKDIQKILDTSEDVEGSQKVMRGVDLALLFAQVLSGRIPQSGIKMIHAYAKALKDAAGDPGYVDYHQLLYYAIEQQWGKETAEKWQAGK